MLKPLECARFSCGDVIDSQASGHSVSESWEWPTPPLWKSQPLTGPANKPRNTAGGGM